LGRRSHHPLEEELSVLEQADDRSLLMALRQGDHGVFWILWQRFSKRLFVLCLREMSGNRADAEDAVEESMLKAFVKLPRFAGTILNPEAWLSQLTRNVCMDLHRERARNAMVLSSVDTGSSPSAEAPEPAAEPSALIAALPERLREVFVLRVIHRMPYKDIATRLDQSAANTRKQVQHARSALRAMRDSTFRPSHVRRARQTKAHQLCSRKIRVRLNSGAEREVQIILNERVARERQRIATLRKYVGLHPAGWKMHLRLADLLYATGAWCEAAECYACVLRKRPALTEAASRLNDIRAVIAG
jgi:RNA polymerase sigma-70 factor (ECF subfamily)